MSVRSFRSVFMVASCAGAALGCYLVSLRVATERASLEDVETKIVLAQRDLRLLQTEIGTRGRLAQLERWNAKVIALSAPSADQFLDGSFELAKLTTPDRKDAVTAPVVLASAPRADARPVIDSDADIPAQPMRPASSGPASLMHEASLKQTMARPAPPKLVVPDRKAPANTQAPAKIQPKVAEKAKKKPAAKPADRTKAAAAADPLAPIPARAAPKKVTLAKASVPTKTTKDSARKQ